MKEKKENENVPSLLKTLLALANRDIQIGVVDGELAVTGKTEKLTQALRAAIDHHRPRVLKIASLRTMMERIEQNLTTLRREEGIDGLGRAESLDKVWKQIRWFQKNCDTPEGYDDPSDPFVDECIPTLWAHFNELTEEGNPYPNADGKPRPADQAIAA